MRARGIGGVLAGIDRVRRERNENWGAGFKAIDCKMLGNGKLGVEGGSKRGKKCQNSGVLGPI